MNRMGDLWVRQHAPQHFAAIWRREPVEAERALTPLIFHKILQRDVRWGKAEGEQEE